MKYDFDTVYDRKNTNSVKYKPHPRYPNSDIIPMWIADMDFKTAPEIIDAVKQAADDGIFGYTQLDDEYFELLKNWNKKRFGFDINTDWVVPCSSVMFASAAVIRALSNVGDSVLILQPVYYPFADVIKDNNRKLVVSELVLKDGKYTIDYEDLENQIVKNDIKIFLFCSPHNPVGRVWEKEEIISVMKICKKYGVFIISDEIHSDLVYTKHYPTLSISSEFTDIIASVTSVTKTFNLAGIKGANLFIPNEEIRNKVKKEIQSTFCGSLETLTIAAIKSAYRYGEDWLEELLCYLKSNAEYVVKSFENTKIKVAMPEGTYLLWLDCKELNLCERELEEFFVRECGVWMNNGFVFGKGGSGFMRMNIACPKSTLEKAIFSIRKNLV